MLRGSDPQRLADDLEFAAQIGLQQVRVDVPWLLAQPRAGMVDGGVMEQFTALAVHARALGLAPWFRLLQTDTPRWFDDDGGFGDAKNAGRWWPRWVEAVATHLGDVAAGWVPMEAPFAIAHRLVPDDPRRHGELMHHLVVAWRDGWRILGGGGPLVATSLDVATERPANDRPREVDAARRRDHLRWHTWLTGLRDGVVRIPGRADQPLADLEGACDVLGLALRADTEGALHRAAEMGPPRPLAVVMRALGTTDSEQAATMTRLWSGIRAAARDLPVASVTAAQFLDQPGRDGIATADRRVKDSGEAFLGG